MPATCPVDVEYPLLADQFLVPRTDAGSKISYVKRTFLGSVALAKVDGSIR
jgi:hypothetical protein